MEKSAIEKLKEQGFDFENANIDELLEKIDSKLAKLERYEKIEEGREKTREIIEAMEKNDAELTKKADELLALIEEKEMFDKENPYWDDHFKDRQNPQNDKSDSIPTCPICKNKLMFMMPDGKTLHCSNCDKFFVNNNGVAGEETGSPYTRKDVLY